MTDRRMLLVAHTGRADIAHTVGAAHGDRWPTPASTCVCLPGEQRATSTSGVFDPADTDDAPIEMVLAIGGDGTLLRAAEHARPLSRAGARHQPRPGRLPDRGRRGRHGRGAVRASSTSATGCRPG